MLIFADKMIMDEHPRKTMDGYLVATPRIARTGIQEYTAGELGLTDRAPDTIVRVYRPEEEVFHQDALHSMAHRPVTNDHPPVMVDAGNWKEFAMGMTGDEVVRDGEFIRVPMSLMDAGIIEDVANGKRELSVGYTADMDWSPGEIDGIQYDAVQRNIRGNHLAVVDEARGGSQLRVIDMKPEPKEQRTMTTTRNVLIDGVNVEVSDTAAQIIQKFMDAAEEKAKTDRERLEEMQDELEEMKKKMDAAEEEKETADAKIATLEQAVEDAKLTPEKLDAAVKTRAAVIDAAKKVKPDVTTDGKTEADIRKEVVASKLGDKAAEWTDEQITASFNTLVDSSAVSGHSPIDTYVDHHIQSGKPGELRGRDRYVDKLTNPEKYRLTH